ncbi:oligosaccharide flippase family protein [Paenibacillus thailandensis]|uniref:Oligosaccharide flippase family protein n=1 Tax=Paenibacillus thailandensis TaxID=393250 RepID=A0ABW5R3N1_9BACL
MKKSSLSLNTLWMLAGNFSRVFMQAVYFVIVARALGADGFGAFVGVTALVGIVSPFIGLGSGNILIKNVSRNHSIYFSEWGTALGKLLWSSLLLMSLLVLGCNLFLPGTIPFILIVCVVLSDGLLMRLLDMCGQAFQAFERMKWTAYLSFLISASRLLGSVVLLILGSKVTLEYWAIIYLSSTLLSSGLATFFAIFQLGKPQFNVKTWFSNLLEGIYFSVSLSSQNIYNDIDKTLLTRLSTLEASGIFAAAYRVIDVAFTPIRSLLNATYPKFFQHGELGVKNGYLYTKKIIPFALIYSIVIGIAMYTFAPILPLFLGEDFENSIEIVKLLSVIPLLKTIHYFAADTISGAGYQGLRSFIQIFIAIFNIILNFILIPEYSWLGAVYTGIISNALLGILLWISVGVLIKKEQGLDKNKHHVELQKQA